MRITWKDFAGTLGSLALAALLGFFGAFLLGGIGAIIGSIVGFAMGAIATRNWQSPKSQ